MKITPQAVEVSGKKGHFLREFTICLLEGLASNPTLGRSKQRLYDS